MDAALFPERDELLDVVHQILIVPLVHVIPKHSRRAGVRHDVRVPLRLGPFREPPVPLRAAGVVVLDERHRARRPPSQHPRGLAVLVGEAPVLLALEHRVENPFGGDVKGTRQPTRVVDPLDDPLPVRILVVLWRVVVVLEGVPELPDGEGHVGALHVRLHVSSAETSDVVQTPPVVSNLALHPLHPLRDVLLDEILGVVDVGRGVEEVALALVTLAAEMRVVAHDGPGVPVELAAVLVPKPVGSLELSAPVVQHRVAEALDAVLVQGLDARLELLFRAVLAVEVVQVPGHVPLLGHRVRGRG